MSESQVEVQPAPEATSARRPRRNATAVHAPAAEATPPAEAAVAPTADVGSPVAASADFAQPPAPAAEALPAATRRDTREPSARPVLVPFDGALPGVSSADIRAELARRERRVPKLMAERAMVIQQMEAIEAALNALGD